MNTPDFLRVPMQKINIEVTINISENEAAHENGRTKDRCA